MQRSYVFGAILFVCLLFAFASEAIVRIKTAELGFQVSRDQLFNYELSSRMLRERFRSLIASNENYSREIKMNVLESGVLNFSDKDDRFELGPVETAGLWIVNIVRRLNLKSFLSLQQDQSTLVLLQYAFFLERTRNYKGAAEKYAVLEKRLKGSPQDHSFVMLHLGFCQALMGKQDQALESLQRVMKEHPGSRSAEDASILVSLLETAKERRQEIEKKFVNQSDRAVALAQEGQYAAALRIFATVENKDMVARYYFARSLEGVGRTPDAITEYVQLVKQQTNRNVALWANRRLLMIGNFYRGGDAVKKIAEDNAKKIGDTVALEEVQKGKELQLKPKVIERIKKQAAEGKGSGATDQELVKQLDELRKDLAVSLKQEEQVAAVVKREAPVLAAEPARPFVPLRIRVKFLDGREVYGESVETEGHFVVVHSGKYQIRLPYTMVAELEAQGTQGQPMLALRLRNGEEKTARRLRRTGDTIVFSEAGKEVEYPDGHLQKALAVIR